MAESLRGLGGIGRESANTPATKSSNAASASLPIERPEMQNWLCIDAALGDRPWRNRGPAAGARRGSKPCGYVICRKNDKSGGFE